MARNSSPFVALVVISAAFAAPAFAAADATAQEQPAAATTDTTQDVRVFDALVVTGATLDGDTQRFANDSDASVPEISDADWVPAQSAPGN